jgi:hypothetical protein
VSEGIVWRVEDVGDGMSCVTRGKVGDIFSWHVLCVTGQLVSRCCCANFLGLVTPRNNLPCLLPPMTILLQCTIMCSQW